MQPVSIRNAPQSSPSKTPPTGIVVVLATGTDDVPQVQQDNFRRICKVIPTQVEYLLESQGLDMLLLVEESPGWTAQSIISCLRLEPIHGNATTSQTWTNLDGTKLTAKPYHLNPQSLSRQSVQHMSTIYVAAIKTELPQYIQKDPSILKKPITPKSCDAPRRYIQATRWYTREMLHLGILQHYDYVLKVDTDILFVDTIPFHLLEDMKRKGAIMGHTAQYHPRGSQTCAKGIHNAVVNFTASVHATTTSWKQSICSASSPELQWDVDWYYTNFVLFDTRFWQSPWILEFANFLSEYLNGFFSYRWTDQIFWHQAMGLFLSNYTDYVVDYTNLRCMPSPNCWRSSYDFKKYGHDAWHRCDNGGYFLHPKDYRISPTSQIKKTRPLGRLLWNDTSYQQELFESTYQMKCS
ncbi:glycolipid 2-alpha-mannosyltransferase [Nitzschia inconspicua]|uniref:Glycolipid 2-alpha-mannosyltransferase n=1 Tax=Nitzschia inconspicua TaxID=303405 RepID=A0A9K3LFG3_9STRA|nr:glycolipid 2-alpha-mannosyltransferase [Nitzschia inconspicua]